MKLILGKRQSGKTYHLLNMADNTFKVIVCKKPQFIKEAAKVYNKNIENPISYGEFLSQEKMLGLRRNSITYLIDDIEDFLGYMIQYRQRIEVVTGNIEVQEVFYSNKEIYE